MIRPTTPLLFWTALSPCVSAQLSSILSSLSLTPVPSSLVTEITPETSSLSSSFASISVSQNASTTAFRSSTTVEFIGITGVASTVSSNASSTTTTAARPRPTQNTTPCNGHPEFCSRRFSNVSMVVAHNSPFVRPRNAASNQVLGVETQLTDGIRGCMFSKQVTLLCMADLLVSTVRNTETERFESDSFVSYLV